MRLETRHLLRLKGISDGILNRRLNEVLLKFEIDQFPVYEFGKGWGNDLNAELMRLDPDENGYNDFSRKLPLDDQTFSTRLY